MKIKKIVAFSQLTFFAFFISLIVSGLILHRKVETDSFKFPNDLPSNGMVASLTLERVSEHSKKEDCWTVIDNKVYAISSYIDFHPGGVEKILKSCGVDASTDFHSKGGEGRDHLVSTNAILKSYYLGDLGADFADSEINNDTGLSANNSGNGLPFANTVPLPTLGNIPSDSTNIAGINTLTSATVSLHNSSNDCWIIVNSNVYNVTSYVPYHPGGINIILALCGGEATTAFNTKGGSGSSHSTLAKNLLANYFIGAIGTPANTNTVAANIPTINPSLPATTGSNQNTSVNSSGTNSGVVLTSSEVALHSTEGNCWIIYGNSVYNVTNYIPFHPGGRSRIVNVCGSNATQAFDTRGGSGTHSNSAKNALNNYLVGTLGSMTSGGGTTTGGSGSTSGGSTSGSGTSTTSTPEATVQQAYPGAVIIKVNYEDDGRKEVKFTWNGNNYTAKLDAANNITDVDD